MYGRGFGRIAPVKVGEELDVKIEGVGEKGDGIARVKGFVLFVPGVKEGDEVRVRVTRVLNRVGFADPITADSAPDVSDESAPAEPETEAEEVEETQEDEAGESPLDSTEFGEDL
jgi:predicted RNA-binding protein with TRAM domain